MYPRDEYAPRKMSRGSTSEDEEVTERLTQPRPSVSTVLRNKFLEMTSAINTAAGRRVSPSEIAIGSNKQHLKDVEEEAGTSDAASSTNGHRGHDDHDGHRDKHHKVQGELQTVYSKRQKRTKRTQTHVAFAEQIHNHGDQAAVTSSSPPPIAEAGQDLNNK